MVRGMPRGLRSVEGAVWGAGDAPGSALCGGGCGMLWGARDAAEVALCGGAYGVLCIALWCSRWPGGCAVRRGACVALACRGCRRGCAALTGVRAVLGCVVRTGYALRAALHVCGMLCGAGGALGLLLGGGCVECSRSHWAIWGGRVAVLCGVPEVVLGALGAHVAVPGGGVWGVVGCSTRMLWRLCCVSRCVERSAVR